MVDTAISARLFYRLFYILHLHNLEKIQVVFCSYDAYNLKTEVR